MADRAVLVSDVGLVVQTWQRRGLGFADLCVAFHAELPDRAAIEHLWVAGTVGGVAGRAAFCLKRSMFEYERALLITVTFDTCRVGAHSELCLLLLKAS